MEVDEFLCAGRGQCICWAHKDVPERKEEANGHVWYWTSTNCCLANGLFSPFGVGSDGGADSASVLLCTLILSGVFCSAIINTPPTRKIIFYQQNLKTGFIVRPIRSLGSRLKR